MTDLVIKRSKNHKLRVSIDGGRASISISGGPDPTDAELEQVRDYLTARSATNAGELMQKLAARNA